MTEPRRLLEGNDEFERDLVRSALRDEPHERAFQRTLVSLGVGLSVMPAAVAGAAPAAVATGAKLGVTVLTKWLVTGIALGVVTAGGANLTERALHPSVDLPSSRHGSALEPRTKAAPPVRERAPSSTESSSSLVETPVETPVTEEAMSETLPAAPPRVGVARARPEVAAASASASAKPQTETTEPAAVASPGAPASATLELLERETKLIDAARGALSRGDAKAALETLTRYERVFVNGALAPEARVLKVRALSAAGQRQAAEALAERVIRDAPAGEHANAVRAALEHAPNP